MLMPKSPISEGVHSQPKAIRSCVSKITRKPGHVEVAEAIRLHYLQDKNSIDTRLRPNKQSKNESKLESFFRLQNQIVASEIQPNSCLGVDENFN